MRSMCRDNRERNVKKKKRFGPMAAVVGLSISMCGLPMFFVGAGVYHWWYYG